RTNLDAQLSESISVKGSFAPAYTYKNIKPKPRSSSISWFAYSPLYAAMVFPPTIAARKDNGDYGQTGSLPHSQYGYAPANMFSPLPILELYKNERKTWLFQNNLSLKWDIIQGLTFETGGSAIIQSSFQ